MLQRISGQARPPPELIQRPAEDQREVFRQERFYGVGCGCAHFDSFVFATRIRLSLAALPRASCRGQSARRWQRGIVSAAETDLQYNQSGGGANQNAFVGGLRLLIRL